MHPLLILLAFTLAAILTYVLVLGLLTALSIPQHEDQPEVGPDSSSDPVARGEHARR